MYNSIDLISMTMANWWLLKSIWVNRQERECKRDRPTKQNKSMEIFFVFPRREFIHNLYSWGHCYGAILVCCTILYGRRMYIAIITITFMNNTFNWRVFAIKRNETSVCFQFHYFFVLSPHALPLIFPILNSNEINDEVLIRGYCMQVPCTQTHSRHSALNK